MSITRSAHFLLFPVLLLIGVVATGCRPVLNIVETGTGESFLEQEVIPINNCGGPAPATIHRDFTRAVSHEAFVEAAVGVSVSAGLNVEVVAAAVELHYEAKLGFKRGVAETRTFGVDLTAPAYRKVVYTLEWRDVYIKGVLVDPNNNIDQGTYRIRKDIKMEILEAHEEACP